MPTAMVLTQKTIFIINTVPALIKHINIRTMPAIIV